MQVPAICSSSSSISEQIQRVESREGQRTPNEQPHLTTAPRCTRRRVPGTGSAQQIADGEAEQEAVALP